MIILIFVFGLIVGSFLNAVIYRLGSPLSLFAKSSICPHCGHELSWLDLIPVVSFFTLGRKCRYCGDPISWQYPLVEIATAVAFIIIYNQLSIIDYRLFFKLAFASFLIVIFVYDLKHFLILDKVVFPAALIALVYQVYQGNWENALLGGALLFGFFGLLYLVSGGRWIGFGDVKLGLFLGLLVAWPQTLALFFLAYFSGAIFALALVLLRQKKMSDRLPFGTFLTFAAFLAMLWGEGIVEWYFGIIGIN
ncbi:MAG: prepilin peptidase [Candidatus Doudnabacteria bacterium]|nr:prepilin peptidase [Candidatus Doudnabacteria bacterium]